MSDIETKMTMMIAPNVDRELIICQTELVAIIIVGNPVSIFVVQSSPNKVYLPYAVRRKIVPFNCRDSYHLTRRRVNKNQ